MEDKQAERFKQTGLMGFYVPMKIGLILIAFFAFIIVKYDSLLVRFEANAPLNSIILGTMFISFGLVLRNVLVMQSAAYLLRRIEKFEDNPSEKESLSILKKLRKNGGLVNTFYMEGAILALKQPGALSFSDNQARVIKSKVGQRTIHMRHSAQYLAGVLVMLGLIGTFWGLLETITSVGEAMGKIVDNISTVAATPAAPGTATGAIVPADTGAGGNGMVEFLKAISTPLQGMGIAFSASLFGLSGSLITGLLNSFCAKKMDRFLEDFSVWLDTRIPPSSKQGDQTDPVEIIKLHNESVVKALSLTLDGITQQSQQMFNILTGLMSELSQFSSQQSLLTRQLTDEKQGTLRIASVFDSGFVALNANLSDIALKMASGPTATVEMRDEMLKISGVLNNMQHAYLAQQQFSHEQLGEAKRQFSSINQALNQMCSEQHSLSQVNSTVAQALETLHGSTIEQKDKIIDLMLTMQRILQAQLSPKLELGSVLSLEFNEKK